MGKHLKLQGLHLDNSDLVQLQATAIHKVSNEAISIQTLAEVLSDLNEYGKANKMIYGSDSVELFDPETLADVTWGLE